MTRRITLLILIALSSLCLIIVSCATVKSGFQGNTYYVRSKVDLHGKTITLPEKGKLVFERKGSVMNGTIRGKNTEIVGLRKNAFDNIHIEGEWRVPEIRSEFFKDILKDDVLKELVALTSDNIQNTIFLAKGDYWVTVTANDKKALELKSNTTLVNRGAIRMRPNNLISYAIVSTRGNHITIDGGEYVGERNQHQGDKGEWGHGVKITEGASNVTVRNVHVQDCWGDGIAVDGNAVNTNILIENFDITNCRRQGISVIFAKDCTIRNGIITNIQGTEPQLGIDIEPNSNGYCEDILVDNVRIDSEKGIGVFTALKEYQTRNVTIKDCKVNTTGYAPFWASRCDGLVLQCNEFTTTARGNQHVVVINTGVKNCTIKGNKLKHLAEDNSHFCIFSAGENVRILNNELASSAGVGFYTDHAVIEDNVVNVPQLMTGACNANDNVFRRNTIIGGISCNATGNQFVENEIKGEVRVKANNCVVKNNKVRK